MNKFLFVAFLCSLHHFTAAFFCTDNNRDCGEWAKRGECFNSPTYMSNNCCNSCKRVSGGNSQTACQDRGEIVSPVCAGGFVIKIRQAFYGKINTHTCGGAMHHSTWCSSNTAQMVAMQRCDGRSSCSLEASSNLFGDPCPGVGKYLTVSWDCHGNVAPQYNIAPAPQYNIVQAPQASAPRSNPIFTYLLFKYMSKLKNVVIPTIVTTCEGAKMTLSCPDNYHVAVKTAQWGRDAKDSVTCNDKKTDYSSYSLCKSPNALALVVAACKGKQACEASPTKATTTGAFGNPCNFPAAPPGAHLMYLRVSYVCEAVPAPAA